MTEKTDPMANARVFQPSTKPVRLTRRERVGVRLVSHSVSPYFAAAAAGLLCVS